jgi:hypothetical protein
MRRSLVNYVRKDATQEKLEQQQAEKQLNGEAKARKIIAPTTKGSKKAQMKELVVAEEEVAQTSSPRPRCTQRLPARLLDDVLYIDRKSAPENLTFRLASCCQELCRVRPDFRVRARGQGRTQVETWWFRSGFILPYL